MASSLASKFVYHEGSSYVESIPRERLFQVALRYLEGEQKTSALLEAVENETGLDPEIKRDLLKVIEKGGSRVMGNI